MKVSDILTVAIRLEEEGERFYRELAEIFRKISDQENWDEVDSYLAGYAFYEVFPDTSEILRRKDLTLKEVLDIAISVEKDSIILYYELKDGFVNSDAQKTVKKIIDQEKEHLRKLLEMKREST